VILLSALDQNDNILNSFSDLLVRSPSCSCVLKDLLETVVNNWHANIGMILIKDHQDNLRPLALINKTNIELKIKFAARDFHEHLSGLVNIQACLITDSQIEFKEDGDMFIFSCPLWIENKIIGILSLCGMAEYLPKKEDIAILQVITNQISLSLEKELAVEKNNTQQYCFNSVLDSLTEGIAIVNVNKIIYSNSLIRRMLKCGVNVNINLEDFFNCVINISKEPFKTQIYLETCRVVEKETYTFEIETKDNSYMKFTKFHILSPGKELLSFGFLVSDITKHKEADKLKNDLMAIVSHELRTPLTSIKGNVSSLLRKDVMWTDEMKDDFLNDIYDECNRLNMLIEKILDISKINAGVLKLQKELIRIDKLLNKFNLKIVNRLFQRQEINFDINNGTDILEIDEEKIQQVLVNLIDNAVKYGEGDVKIKIGVRREDDMVLFSVADNGPGIAQDVLDKIFQKFYQVNNSSHANNLGSGLGLAICKGFVQAHGGTIWVGSTLGKGSTFYFTLPLKKEGGEVFG